MFLIVFFGLQNIYHWSGSESNRFERLKTTLVANDIRDNERKGRADVHMITEGNEPPEVISVSDDTSVNPLTKITSFV